MRTDLHNALRSLCSDTAWKYAVFWKLTYRSQMVLTWEDAYYEGYDHHGFLDSNNIDGDLESSLGGHSQTNQLGLAVAKMSYHGYAFGEGIVGQVAVTGRHRWIFSDNLFDDSFSCFEKSDGWQSQLSAGIRTIAFIAVVPYGVVQLGSLDKVVEDIKLIGDIRNAFLSLHSSCFVHGLNTAFYTSTGVEAVNKHEGAKLPLSGTDEIEKLSRLRFSASCFEDQKQIMRNLISNQICEMESNFLKEDDRATKCGTSSLSYIAEKDNNKAHGYPSPFGLDLAIPPTNLLGSSVLDKAVTDGVTSYLDWMLKEAASSSVTMEKDLGNQVGYEGETSNFDSEETFMMFSAGYELHEALGPVFLKRYVSCDQDQKDTQAENDLEFPEGRNSSYMAFDTTSGSLLEAVVSNACRSGSDVINDKSVCKSLKSLLTTEKLLQPPTQSNLIINAAGHSINYSFVKEDTRECSNSTKICDAVSSRGFSKCISGCSKRLERRSEPAKNKKRARPGESCRPRPRDRQLIQDRIKELRDLVPNGSKCSIDSLLERSIKHMLFLESITKHADKLNKCAESKMHQKRTIPHNYDHGSSWAVEVGGDLKISSIVVENLNKNGQMLVEMLCEECSHFLVIAEAIRGLGLTILKGVTEMQGEKTWICFVVEGQNNRLMHRMDILWSLVQVLQQKTTN